MPNPATTRAQRLRKKKAQLIDEIDTLEQHAAATAEGGTELKRREQELAEKEAQLRLVFDNMPGAIVYTDEELNLVFCSDRFADISQAPSELLQPGCPYPNYLRYLAEHGYYGEGDVDAFVAERVESLRNPSDKTFETRMPDGHIHQVRRRIAAGFRSHCLFFPMYLVFLFVSFVDRKNRRG